MSHVHFCAETTNDICYQLTHFLHSISPYLFPFVMEYSLIALSMTAIIYGSVNYTKADSFRNLKYLFTLRGFSADAPTALEQTNRKRKISQNETEISSLDSWMADPLAIKHSNVGAFLGGLMFAGVLACLIATAMQSQVNEYKATITYLVTDLTISSILLIASIITLLSIMKLPRVQRAASVDDLLLIVAMSGSFLFYVTIMIPTVDYSYVNGWSTATGLMLASIITAIIHTFVQTVLLLAAMRSYSYTVKEGHKYPARQAITFLAFGNVITWIYRIFRGLQHVPFNGSPSDLSFVFWQFLLHLTLPLLLFFYFHSSVCFADVWHSAYEPLTSKLQPCVISDDIYTRQLNGRYNDMTSFISSPAVIGDYDNVDHSNDNIPS